MDYIPSTAEEETIYYFTRTNLKYEDVESFMLLLIMEHCNYMPPTMLKFHFLEKTFSEEIQIFLLDKKFDDFLKAREPHTVDFCDAVSFMGGKRLLGTTDNNMAAVYNWSNYADLKLYTGNRVRTKMLLGLIPFMPEIVQRENRTIQEAFAELNRHLKGRLYLVEDNAITLADIRIFSHILNIFRDEVVIKWFLPYHNLVRWFCIMYCQRQTQIVLQGLKRLHATMQNTVPHFSVLGNSFECEMMHMLVPDACNPIEINNPNYMDHWSNRCLTEVIEKRQKVYYSMDVNPFDLMKFGTFDISELKRRFIDCKVDKTVDWLWKHFDAAHYSIWHCSFKHNELLQHVHKSRHYIMNLMDRVTGMRDHAFAVMCVFGEDWNQSISGVWVWRGQKLPFKLNEFWQEDYGCFEWNKLDPSVQKTKICVRRYFSMDLQDKQKRSFKFGEAFV